MEAILIHPKSEDQIKAFEQMAKALKVPFQKIESKHNLEYEIMLKESFQQAKEGKTVMLKLEDLWR